MMRATNTPSNNVIAFSVAANPGFTHIPIRTPPYYFFRRDSVGSTVASFSVVYMLSSLQNVR